MISMQVDDTIFFFQTLVPSMDRLLIRRNPYLIDDNGILQYNLPIFNALSTQTPYRHHRPKDKKKRYLHKQISKKPIDASIFRPLSY